MKQELEKVKIAEAAANQKASRIKERKEQEAIWKKKKAIHDEKIKKERFSRIKESVEKEFLLKNINDKDLLEKTIKFKIEEEEKDEDLKEKAFMAYVDKFIKHK